MTKKTFVATESDIGKRWEEKLEDSMKQAAEEEKELAIEQNSYHEGIPSISVIVDAGWSKRSHKHSYNAKSGVGIIIEMKTKNCFILMNHIILGFLTAPNTVQLVPGSENPVAL